MADESRKLQDRIDYLIEATGLAEQVRKINRAEELLLKALEQADRDDDQRQRVLLRISKFYNERFLYEKSLEYLSRLVESTGLSATQRAQVILMLIAPMQCQY